MVRITKQRMGEIVGFVALMGGLHLFYYKLQSNNSLVPPEQRTELFYMRWLKNTFPSLKNIGIDDSERLKRDEDFLAAKAARKAE